MREKGPSEGITELQQAFFTANTLACIDSGLAQHYHRIKQRSTALVPAPDEIAQYRTSDEGVELAKLFHEIENAYTAEGLLAFAVNSAGPTTASIRITKLDSVGRELPHAALTVGFVFSDGGAPELWDDFTPEEFAWAFERLKQQRDITGLTFWAGDEDMPAWVFAD